MPCLVDEEAMVAVEGKPPGDHDDASQIAAFEAFRSALVRAHKLGHIDAMREAVSAYDRYAAAIGQEVLK
jgi:hypothetical protein